MQKFVQMLTQVAKGMGFIIDQPFVYEMQSDHAGEYVRKFEELRTQRNPMFILFAVPNNRLDRYAAIKKKCCVDKPVPSQVILAKSMQAKSVMSIATKVAIQINCKVGGIPWTISIPCPGLMVVGFDVCHDANNKSKDFGKNNVCVDIINFMQLSNFYYTKKYLISVEIFEIRC